MVGNQENIGIFYAIFCFALPENEHGPTTG